MDYPHLSDERLIELFVSNGDEVAFESLYRRYFVSLCKYLNWMSGASTECEDLVQDVFLKIYRKPELFRKEKNVKVWLLTCVKNRWFNHQRSVATHARHVKQSFSPEIMSIDVEDNEMRQNRLKKIELAVDNLTAIHRETFVLRFSSNLLISEIAEVMKCSEGTVKSRLFHAMRSLKNDIK